MAEPVHGGRGQDGKVDSGTITVSHQDGVTVLALIGEHDLSRADQLSVMISEHAELGRGVVVVLSEADFIDSGIIRELFAGDQLMIAHGRRLVVQSDPASTLENVLAISGVRAQLLCSDTLDEAVRLSGQCYRDQD
jgi:anti-anti-sigma factor